MLRNALISLGYGNTIRNKWFCQTNNGLYETEDCISFNRVLPAVSRPALGGDKIVYAGGNDSQLYETSDYKTWTKNRVTYSFNFFTKSPNKYLVARDSSNVLYSTDKVNWTLVGLPRAPSATGKNITALTYASSFFVLGWALNLSECTYWVSSDGANWTAKNIPSIGICKSCTTVNNILRGITQLGYKITSTDGSNITYSLLQSGLTFTTMDFYNDTGVYLAYNSSGKWVVITEIGNVKYTSTLEVNSSYDDCVCWSEDKWVIIGKGKTAISKDSINWEVFDNNLTYSPSRALYINLKG